MKIRTLTLAALGLALPLAALAHGSAHVHGLAQMDIAVEAQKISIALQTPLDNLVGFERAPRTDNERKRADDAVAKLRAGNDMFKFDAAAGCKLANVSLESPALGLGNAKPAASGGHAELHGSWTFDCADTAQAAQLEVGLFTFNQLKRVQVQLVLPKAQLKRELKRPNGKLSLRP